MARLSAEPIVLSGSERKELEALIGRHKTSQQIALWAKIILQAAEGHGHGEMARCLNVSRDMSRLWRRRWLALSERGIPVVERLKDAPRPGCPATFSIEQLTRLYAMACDPPEQYGRPIDHWSARELADEMVICDVYAQAQARLAEGEMTLCFDDLAQRGPRCYRPCDSRRNPHRSRSGCPWLNQMELWFSILMRKLLRRSNFTSQEDLKAQILAFVDYFNRTMAKPFKWPLTLHLGE